LDFDENDVDRLLGVEDSESVWQLVKAENLGPRVLLLISRLFWPSFITIDGFVFLKENFDADYYQEVLSTCSRDQVEATINTVYLYDVIRGGAGDVAEVGAAWWQAVGKVVADAWKERAEKMFPGVHFVSEFNWYSPPADDPGVVVYQKPKN